MDKAKVMPKMDTEKVMAKKSLTQALKDMIDYGVVTSEEADKIQGRIRSANMIRRQKEKA